MLRAKRGKEALRTLDSSWAACHNTFKLTPLCLSIRNARFSNHILASEHLSHSEALADQDLAAGHCARLTRPLPNHSQMLSWRAC